MQGIYLIGKTAGIKVPAKARTNALLAASFLSLFGLKRFSHNWPRTMKRYLTIPSSPGDSSRDPASTGPILLLNRWKGIGRGVNYSLVSNPTDRGHENLVDGIISQQPWFIIDVAIGKPTGRIHKPKDVHCTYMYVRHDILHIKPYYLTNHQSQTGLTAPVFLCFDPPSRIGRGAGESCRSSKTTLGDYDPSSNL